MVGGDETPRKVALNGPVTDLLLKKNEEPSILKILSALARGDEL